MTESTANGTLQDKNRPKNGAVAVHYIGTLNRELYRCVTQDITTDEVIITDERIQHIKERHPGDYARYFGYLKEIVEDPDYILAANKARSALLLKTFADNGKNYKVILRIKTSVDTEGYKNSIISFQKVDDRRYRRYTRSEKVLYKRE